MKKAIGIIILGLLWCGTVTSAEVVLYCFDKNVTGMDGDYSVTKDFKEEKFTAKIDLDKKILIINGKEYNQIGDPVLNIFTNDTGKMIRLFPSGKDKVLGFHRSSVFGMSDAIYIADGECGKF